MSPYLLAGLVGAGIALVGYALGFILMMRALRRRDYDAARRDRPADPALDMLRYVADLKIDKLKTLDLMVAETEGRLAKAHEALARIPHDVEAQFVLDKVVDDVQQLVDHLPLGGPNWHATLEAIVDRLARRLAIDPTERPC